MRERERVEKLQEQVANVKKSLSKSDLAQAMSMEVDFEEEVGLIRYVYCIVL